MERAVSWRSIWRAVMSDPIDVFGAGIRKGIIGVRSELRVGGRWCLAKDGSIEVVGKTVA